ncbi:unnamed protein product [Ceutorhynchus assimilis]|uniref:Major facilitator superfamily (MFS) profile domain-containing protein n=1 Tax=Ceutorhynchus assimilis TaxID=467358 RepID=A0A9N9MFM8_9CUCU|nr:unnamed protein product [Ceutorhynchus assimilis]
MEDAGREWPQILTIVFACIPGISSALILTWTSVFLPVITSDYGISEDEANMLPIVTSLGCMIPALFFYKLPDLMGRKYTLLLLNVPQATYWLFTIFAKDMYSLCVARFLGGLADAIMYSALPIYLGEVTTPKIRGSWGNGQTFSFNAGFFLISTIGSYVSIQNTAYIFITLPIFCIIAFSWLPESPYYYLMKNKEQKARDSLKWLLRKENIEPDFQQLRKDVERQISETGTWADLFKIKSNRRALIACVFIRWGQQCAGIAVFEGYFRTIFEKTETALSPEVSAIIFSGWLWVVMTIFSFFLDTFGRRKSFIFSSLGCVITLAAEAIYFYIDEFRRDMDLTSVKWFPIVGLLFYLIFYAVGLGILPSLMAGELFSASIKTKALSFANFMMGLIVFAETYTFKSLSSLVGLYAPFAVFAIATFICFILAFYIVPETKGKTLEEIQQDLKASKKNNKTFY